MCKTCLCRGWPEGGYLIQKVADTAARSPGKDIDAIGPDGRVLWVSVKGYPEKSKHTQARHWFAGGILDLVRYRHEREDVSLALCLPDGFTTYQNLARQTPWLRNAMPFVIYWVLESGEVRVEN